MKTLQIAAGIIVFKGKVLLGQRLFSKDQGGLWEFPGGKLEEHETLEECLKRELSEEMNLPIEIERFFMKSMCAYETKNVCLHVFLASVLNPQISVLTAHEKYVWVNPEDLVKYNLAPADIPVAKAYIDFVRKTSI